jgi:hypothetical protein
MLSSERKEEGESESGWWLYDAAIDRPAFGMILHMNDGVWTVARTLIGSPAEQAGIKQGSCLQFVDGFRLGENTSDFLELSSLMKMDNSPTHILTFSDETEHVLEKKPLRDLIAFDYENGGASLRGCYHCRSCRSATIGATDCSSGCPGNYCTVG